MHVPRIQRGEKIQRGRQFQYWHQVSDVTEKQYVSAVANIAGKMDTEQSELDQIKYIMHQEQDWDSSMKLMCWCT